MNINRNKNIQNNSASKINVSVSETLHGIDVRLINQELAIARRIRTVEGKTYTRLVTREGPTWVPISKLLKVKSSFQIFLNVYFDFYKKVEIDDEEDKLWVLRMALIQVLYSVKSLEYFLPNLKIEWRSIDFSFGLERITDLSTYKSAVKSSLIWPSSNLGQGQRTNVLPYRGHVRRYLVKYFRTRPSQKKIGLAQTLLIGLKKVSFSLPSKYIDENVEGCLERYTAPPRQTKPWIDRVEKQFSFILGNYTWNPSEYIDDFSLRSTLESSRKAGGSYGKAIECFGKEESISYGIGSHSSELGVKHVTRTQLLLAAYPDMPFSPIFIEYEDYFNRTNIFEDIQEFKEDEIINWVVEPGASLQRKVVGLPEPLKIRCITLSHWWESPFWADLQLSLFNKLKQDHCVCSGKEIPTEYFQRFVTMKHRCTAALGLEFIYISDDGDAATDSLCLDLTHRSLISIIPDEYKEIYRLCCGLDGNNQCSSENTTVYQTNSQLMGDRLSFVKLTLIHLAVKKSFLSKKYDQYSYWLRKAEISKRDFFDLTLINGDDGLICIPEFWHQEYFTFMNEMWNINELKTQISTKFFSLNSRMFYDNGGEVTEPSWFRWNLIERIDRGGNYMINPQVWNTFQESAPPNLSEQLWRDFHREWSPTLQMLCKGGNNYFMPMIAGGLGLDCPTGIKPYYTERQLAVAFRVLRSEGKVAPRPRHITTIVPSIEGIGGVSRKIFKMSNYGITRNKLSVDSSSSRVKGITKATKLKTKRLPWRYEYSGEYVNLKRLKELNYDLIIGSKMPFQAEYFEDDLDQVCNNKADYLIRSILGPNFVNGNSLRE